MNLTIINQIFTLFIILFSLMVFSQNNTKPVYIYLDNQEVSKEQYKQLDVRKFYTKEIEKDTAVIRNIYLHKIIGKLDSVQHVQINMFLQKIIGANFSVKKKTLIHLYNKNGDQLHNDAKYKKHWQWIRRNSDNHQAFLIGTKNSQIIKDVENHTYLDSYNLLHKLFFKKSDFEINHLLIKPDGKIYIYYGIDNILTILDWSVD